MSGILAKGFEILLGSLIFGLFTGIILQHSQSTADTFAAARDLAVRASYAGRAGLDPNIRWDDARWSDANAEMDALLYDLDWRMTSEVHACFARMVEEAKLSRFEKVISLSEAQSGFNATVRDAVDAAVAWRCRELWRIPTLCPALKACSDAG